jgi:prolyl oligopeptidase
MRRPLPLFVLLHLGCASTSAPREAPRAQPPPVEAPTPPRDPTLAENDRVRAPLTETVHGVTLSDPYRALETDSPATQRWVAYQNARSEDWIRARTRPHIERRLSQLLDIGILRGAAAAGPHVLYLAQEGGRQTAVLMIATRAPQGWGAPRELLDPTRYGERAVIDWFRASPRGRYVAFGVSQNGDERSVLRVLDTTTGAVREEAIEHAKWCRLTWMPDESGFYYTRYPRAGDDGYDAAREDTYHSRLFFHRLGQSPDGGADAVVFRPEGHTERAWAEVSDDGRSVLVHLFKGWSTSVLYVIPHDPAHAAWTPGTATPVITAEDTLSSGVIHRGSLYVLTNASAPKYRVVTQTLAQARQPAADEAARAARWRVVVPEGEHPLDDMAVAGDWILVSRMENIVSRVRLHALNGQPGPELTLPGDGSLGGVSASASGGVVALSYSSFVTPPTVLGATLPRRGATESVRPAEIARAQSDFDFSSLELRRAAVPSQDGTPINVWLMHRRGLAQDGTAPVLLNGYGGFNLSLQPRFNRDPLYWVERGGVYAVANLRGGSEFGEAWHRAGAREHKHHVFEDFEAVIRWLTSSGLSRPSRVAIYGGSNGGLLMGAMITRCPDAFAAAFSTVGLYDMARFHRFPPAEIWTSEYGDPEQPDALRWLAAYSPYHRVPERAALPAVWIETADHDTRVHWAHSTKFAARLQDANTADSPVMFYMQRDVGHGAGARREDQLRQLVRRYAFLEDRLGLPAPTQP